MALKIALQILSPLPLTSHEEGRLVFELWQTYLPRLLPDKFGNWEPIDHPFSLQKIDAALNAWQWPFLAVRKNPPVDASIWMRKGAHQRLHATWIFRLDNAAASEEELLNFLRAASVALKADFSCLHLLTPTELERGRASKVVSTLNKEATKFSFLIGTKDLQDRIPDLFWATVLGAPYIKMFGRDRLLSVPAYSARALSDETVLLQMTEKLSDVAERPSVFDDARQKVKLHLGEDAFFYPRGPALGSYRTPEFSFTSEAQGTDL